MSTQTQLRILAVGNMYPPHHAGGYEAMWEAAMRRARSLGHQVRVLATDYLEDPERPETDPDVHRVLRWYWDLSRYEFPRLTVSERVRIERHNASTLDRHLRNFDPDIVSWWSMGCMSLGLIERVRRRGMPAMFVVHDDWLVYGPHYDQWIRIWRGRRRAVAPVVERVLDLPTEVNLNAAGPFVFNSDYTRERARGVGLDAPTAVVYPGIDERFLKPCPPRRWSWRLAYIGRIDRQKGVDVGIRALAHLPVEARLSIWGTGDNRYTDEMRQLAIQLGVAERVRFEGWADPDQLVEIYDDVDAVVFPVRWNEPFGLVPIEAMGLGRSVVTTARGGTAEFVRDGENALVFEADDEAGLAHAVERLAADEQLRQRLREGGMRTAAEFTTTKFAERTVEEIIRAAVTGRPPASMPT